MSVGNDASANAGTWLMKSQLAGTPIVWVTPISALVSRSSTAAGSKVRTTSVVPPKWKAGLAKTLRPPVWKSGRIAEIDHVLTEAEELDAVDRVPERHPLRDDRPLRTPGGTGGVHDREDVLVVGRLGLGERLGRRDAILVRRGIARLAPHEMRWRMSQIAASVDAVPANPSSWMMTSGPQSPTMNSSSGTARRQLTGTKTAPSFQQANSTSKKFVSFSARTTTRSPRSMAQSSRRAVASPLVRSFISAYVNDRPVARSRIASLSPRVAAWCAIQSYDRVPLGCVPASMVAMRMSPPGEPRIRLPVPHIP
jgi:hypothetical protein